MAMTPTYYGPAPTYLSAADYQTAGALCCAVQFESRMELKNDGPHLIEKFKTNTRAVLSTGGKSFNVHGAAFLPDNPRPDIDSNPAFIMRFPTPTTDSGFVWVVEDVEIEQQEAGDHSVMTVRSHSVEWQEGSPLSAGQIQVLRDRWDLDFKPINMSVLAYCKNENKPPYFVDYLPTVNGDPRAPSRSEASNKSNARYIKECASGSKYNAKWGQVGAFQWVRNQSIYELNANEKKIFNYYVNGINPVLHVPVITHTIVTKYARDPDDAWVTGGHVKHIPDNQTIGEIDEVITQAELNLTQCPYKFNQTWEWLKTASRVTENVSPDATTYTHVEEFTGAKKWCGDFYDGGSWSINGQPTGPWSIGEE